MAEALVALGSNLGARAALLETALDDLARLPATRLIRRSGWFATPPIGGPAGQDPFLNGAALVSTTLAPRQLLAELQRIEEQLGRVRGERWGARVIDLDLLLFDRQVIDQSEFDPALRSGGELIVPHPRMAFRRFVLEPATATAPWMVHPTSGWTVQALCAQLTRGANVVAVAAENLRETTAWIERLQKRFGLPSEKVGVATSSGGPQAIVSWEAYRERSGTENSRRPKLLLAFPSSEQAKLPTFHASDHSRRMPNLPTSGPIAWIPSTGVAEPMVEAAAAIQAVWPELASIVPPAD